MIIAIKILVMLSIVSIIATAGLFFTIHMLMKDIKGNKDNIISEQLKEILNRL
tara:strand:- start:242 stop:400 length:159 start_codon:yes stop_codon:yes gene_type:complete